MPVMVFDLGRAMRKKEEFESARLIDFDFRRRVRAARLLAASLGLDEAIASDLVATRPEAEVLARMADLAGVPESEISIAYPQMVAQAHQQLVVERGDPTPYRLG